MPDNLCDGILEFRLDANGRIVVELHCPEETDPTIVGKINAFRAAVTSGAAVQLASVTGCSPEDVTVRALLGFNAKARFRMLFRMSLCSGRVGVVVVLSFDHM